MHSILRALPAVLVSALVLAGCSSTPSTQVYVNADPTTSVASFRTYGFEQPLGTDRSGYSSLLSQYLREATSREMGARGYVFSETPDVLVNFNVQTKDKIKATSVPAGPAYGGYYGYRSGYYGVWNGYDTQVTQYTEGTLSVDVVDAARKQLIWEGTVVGRVREKDRENLQPLIDGVITQVFEKFPHQGGGAPPKP